MSSPSLPKSSPPLFESANGGKALAFLLQPMSLAVLASLGVHGLLWFGLPMMPAAETKQADAERSVPLVELSPMEQARLPQIASSPLLGVPNQAIAPNSLTMIPTAPQTSVEDSTSLYTVPPPLSSSTITEYSVSPFIKRAARQPVMEENEEPAKPEPSSKTTEKETEKLSEPEEGEDSNVSKKAADLLPPNPQETSGKLALQQKYAYSGTNTTQEEFASNSTEFSEIAQTVSKGDISEDWKKLDAMSAPYPKDACQFKHDGKAIAGEPWFGVVVQPNGKLAAKPTLLRSSGFKGLDEAAVEFITKQDFEAGKQYRGFYFPIKFEAAKTDCVASDMPKPAS
jgi:hypothetical protein